MATSLKQRLIRLFAVRSGVSLAPDVHVGPFSIVSSPTLLTIGANSYIGKNCTVQVAGSIGRGVLIANNVGIVGRIDHEYRVPGVRVRDGQWTGSDRALAELPENRILIHDDVWIGFGAVVLSGVVIGEGAIVSSGSVVTRDIEPYDIVAGNPARTVSRRFGGDAEAIAKHQLMLRQHYGQPVGTPP